MNEYSEAARAADRARIVELDAEIQELQARIRLLQLERYPCQQRLDAYRYPVLSLPNEIVGEIFIHFLPPYPDCPPSTGIDSPTTLTHICSQWREIALATPKLWRALLSYRANDQAAHAQRIVQTWLERSGSCPLSIKLERDHLVATDRKESLIATLLHRERWQHVRLDLRTDEVALIEGPLPLLESLDLSLDKWHYTHPTTVACDFPRLRSVTLDDADHGNWLPLSQLTTLTLKDVYEINYLPLLRDAVNLIHLYLIQCIPLESGHTLTRLETLVVVDYPGRPQTLDMFTLPALCRLQWSESSDGLGQDHINSVTALISRSGCKLQQVLFTGTCDVSEESLRAAFPSIPKVTLDIEYDWYSEESRGFKNGLGI
ncbi:hypothetical protein FB45DRAFT_825375 [Roridomyces roridus]|uniref:F-box domain-containing protein n=1 Tax=Roridomyces roridus TaxID=1738132 RepID=A0AAD7C7S0_9AGAR|nr:hypothetical protein FB45DRAFT_825375 [Roridomyces roridus]